jgi:two-component system, OmpR family, response regulator BaeR
VFARSQLLDGVHTDMRDVSDRAIDSHVKNLRRKIEAVDPGCNCIASVYGVGYRFAAPVRQSVRRLHRRGSLRCRPIWQRTS